MKNWKLTRYLKGNLENLPFFYDRAIFIYRILKTKDIKKIYLLFLIKLVLKLFNNRNDFFDVNLLLNGIYEQFKLKKEKLNFNFLALQGHKYSNSNYHNIRSKSFF